MASGSSDKKVYLGEIEWGMHETTAYGVLEHWVGEDICGIFWSLDRLLDIQTPVPVSTNNNVHRWQQNYIDSKR